jgi:hypothetical protein
MRRISIVAIGLATVAMLGGCGKNQSSSADTIAARKASASPTPTPTPDPQAKGDCHVGGHTTTNKTKAECDDMGGNWSANKPTTSPTGSPTPKP